MNNVRTMDSSSALEATKGAMPAGREQHYNTITTFPKTSCKGFKTLNGHIIHKGHNAKDAHDAHQNTQKRFKSSSSRWRRKRKPSSSMQRRKRAVPKIGNIATRGLLPIALPGIVVDLVRLAPEFIQSPSQTNG